MPKNSRLLLVDDNKTFLLAIREAVLAALPGIQVETTESASDALKLLDDTKIDVIVSDVTMPSMDGIRFLDHVHEKHPDIPVILLTGKDDRELAVLALRHGAHDLLTKPVEQLTLAAAIERAVETTKLRRELRQYQLDLERKVHERTKQLSFLSNASKRLASSLDYKTTINEIAKLAVPDIADYCLVHMVDLGGKIERLATEHKDPRKVEMLQRMVDKYPTPMDAPAGYPNVMRTGKSELMKHIPLDLAKRVAQNEEHENMILELAMESSLCVPIKLQGTVIGTITMVTAESGRRYSEDDLALAEELAFRASLAIESAMLYSQSQNEVRQRVRAESELRESEERFRVMADHAPVLIWVAGKDGEFYYFNRPWLEFRGRKLEEESGNGWFEGVHPEDRARCSEIYNASFHKRQPFEMEYRLMRHDGEYRWLIDLGVPRFGPQNKFEGFIGSCIDIHDRKIMEAELREAKEDAERASKAKDQFLAVLSHELRTPLTPVLNILQILQEDEEVPESMRSFIDIAIHNVNVEARIVNDLLKVTEISAGKLQLTTEPVELHSLIHSVIPTASKTLKDKHIELTLDLRARGSSVSGDPVRLHQVIGNLLENAVKFTPEHGKIKIATENLDDQLRVSVSDTGIGIKPELLPVIFNTFEQGESSIHRQFGGLGLGLSISRGLVALHGGHLEAASEGIGKGTTISFALPTVEAAKPMAPRIDAVKTNRNEQLRLLIVEDNKHTSQAVKTLLERRGYQVDVAETLGDGIAAVRGKKYDLVISDLGLPDGSGLDITKHIDPDRTRAIAVSGFCSESDMQESRAAGFAFHLAKPFDFKKLQEVIDKVLDRISSPTAGM